MRHNLLYVEDDQGLSNVVAAYLCSYGIQVDCASSRSAAQDWLSRKRYSLILLDCRLSRFGTEGFEFACVLNEMSPWQPLLIFTACSSPELHLESAKRGIDVIYKPKPLPELKRIIESIFEERYERRFRKALSV
jgi:DNA-binding response OmpR family regulator